MNKKEITEKAKVLLSKMTWEQKLAQTLCMFGGGQVPLEILKKFPAGIGEIAFIPGTATARQNAERAKKERDILMNSCGVPAIRHNEALSGQMTADSTVFPSAIALGASWDPEVVEKMADIIRRQMVAEGTRQALSPVMDVARDPRWGRTGETYGEDPTLCARMSVAFVKGIQSEDLRDGVIATGKHFLGYAMSEGGLNMAANPIPERELREVYAKPFQAAITKANLRSVMNSYGSIDGEMVIGSHHILTDLLKEEMGFDGLVVSDYMSINKMTDLKVAPDAAKAGLIALKAGLDVEMPVPYGFTGEMAKLLEEDEEGREALDRAALKVLEAKVSLGLLEGPAERETWIEDAYDRDKVAPVNLQAAKESVVLLKNNGILPLHRDHKKIALIGPHADSIRLLFGCYTYPAAFDRDVSGSMADMPGMQSVSQQSGDNPYQMPYLPGCEIRGTHPYIEEALKNRYAGVTPTIREALEKKFENAQIRTAKGYEIAGTDRSGFEEALKLAAWADLVIVIGGGKYGWGTSCTTGEGIDCDRIGLPGVQEELALKVAEVNPNCIFVHMDTKPLSSEAIDREYAAILEYWFPGDTGGEALAEVLSGDYNPAGRLPMTAPRNAGQIPIYSSQRRGSGYHPGNGMTIAKYAEGRKDPLYCFGYGKSYTEFAYSDITVTPETEAEGKIEVSCKVRNIGSRAGEEVVQLYVSDDMASMLRPEQELAGFYRVFVKAGEIKTIHFSMQADQFAFLDKDMDWIVEEGSMSVRIGSSSDDIRLTGAFEIRNTALVNGKSRGFYADAWEE